MAAVFPIQPNPKHGSTRRHDSPPEPYSLEAVRTSQYAYGYLANSRGRWTVRRVIIGEISGQEDTRSGVDQNHWLAGLDGTGLLLLDGYCVLVNDGIVILWYEHSTALQSQRSREPVYLVDVTAGDIQRLFFSSYWILPGRYSDLDILKSTEYG
ncbi:hypothetical protein ACMFMG_007714 [Clarireedia jacksonii]